MNVKLRNGLTIPYVGLGTYKIRGKDTVYKTLKTAIGAGYRLIDTAAVYRNESDIGEALQELLPSNHLKREDIFITSKLSPKDQGTGTCYNACVQSIKHLQCQYLDLYLIHWPGVQGCKPGDRNQKHLRVGSWTDMIRLRKEGKVKCIGVSNFLQHHIDELHEQTGVYPDILQTEHHPYLIQSEMIQYCKDKEIFYQAYSSLGTSDPNKQLLSHPVILDISKDKEKTPAQVFLRWAVQQGIGVLPKSVNPLHIKENFNILSFDLTDEEMQRIYDLNKGQHLCWNPEFIV